MPSAPVGHPFFRGPIIDSATYHRAATALPSLVLLPALVLLRRTRRRWLVAALVVLGALPPSLVTAHHDPTHGAPGTRVSWDGGLNLWLGNNPDRRDTWRARPGAQFEPLAEQALHDRAHTTSELVRPRQGGATARCVVSSLPSRASAPKTLAECAG